LRGLKTTYYLRTLGATHAEKSTVARGALNAVPSDGGVLAEAAQSQPKVCSILDPDCEACQ
jgi:ribonucleoside-diphosphate reductase alpha chain